MLNLDLTHFILTELRQRSQSPRIELQQFTIAMAVFDIFLVLLLSLHGDAGVQLAKLLAIVLQEVDELVVLGFASAAGTAA